MPNIKGQNDLVISLTESSKVLENTSTARLLNRLQGVFRRHLIISEAQATALAAWTMHTYVYRKFRHTPRLAITSPEKGCGKSTVIELLVELCYNPLSMDNATESVIFRLTDQAIRSDMAGITLLIDEADSFMPRHEGIRNLLNSGFKSSGSVYRSARSGQDFDPRGFMSFAPVAIAGIGDLPDTVTSRSIPIRLRRKTNAEQIERVWDHFSDLAELKGLLEEWAKDADFDLAPKPEIPKQFSDREINISVPLLTIAELAGGNWPGQVRSALTELYTSNNTESTSSMLLADLRNIFRQKNDSKLASNYLCQQLGKLEDRPWPEFNKGKEISPPQMARLLKSFGIGPRDIRLDNKAGIKGYLQADFMDAWSRYLPPEEPESGVTH